MIMGIFGKAIGTVLAFMPMVAKIAGIMVYLSLFLPAISGITLLFTKLIMLVPLPGGANLGLAGFINTIVAFSIGYYLAVKLEYIPPE